MPLDIASTLRRFSVHDCEEAPRCSRRIEAVSFEDAALRFVEDAHPAGDAKDAVSLIVEDCASGERQCFRIDLASGAAAPCD